MRISDWSSDVCSSDLALIEDAATLGDLGRMRAMLAVTRRAIAADPADPRAYYLQAVLAARAGRFDLARVLLQKTGGTLNGMAAVLDRKSVVSGKSVSVRVDLGGRRIIQKKKATYPTQKK